jgi:hypothetical protein
MLEVCRLRRYTCKLCDRTFEGVGSKGIGHVLSKGGVCCDECNYTKVLPARMRGEHL